MVGNHGDADEIVPVLSNPNTLSSHSASGPKPVNSPR